ncbi:uncharacterized protein MELLADRAFT_109045 [Melampsora larici-populina 98AG31]|uniref:Uncharacterized protein n=1 Tax=Melampsora larici-populina (strain 98AG31 / pathotype 3-4-7) TaxID=747676 RepID=F4RV55_MELLP|nr:uncharacterized protein MELLADRAFT_109045 [Melampsora larici-populina 98AG31]EGG03560.1 hypothetical protein MELLADRAFT_109045 [Melampsora larici-populina 98AG31]
MCLEAAPPTGTLPQPLLFRTAPAPSTLAALALPHRPSPVDTGWGRPLLSLRPRGVAAKLACPPPASTTAIAQPNLCLAVAPPASCTIPVVSHPSRHYKTRSTHLSAVPSQHTMSSSNNTTQLPEANTSITVHKPRPVVIEHAVCPSVTYNASHFEQVARSQYHHFHGIVNMTILSALQYHPEQFYTVIEFQRRGPPHLHIALLNEDHPGSLCSNIHASPNYCSHVVLHHLLALVE